jgi:YD repeat-containing protein
VQLVTNPFRSPSDPTWGSTTYQYDGLSRVTRLTLQDGNYQQAFYGSGVGAAGGRTTQLCAGGTYGLGYPTLSKDETGKKRQNWVDAFGLLIEADEPDATGALTLGTCYRYDVLGNLIQVDQGSQTRSDTYDALSRLTAATTPEAGTVNYFYTTAGGALCSGNPKAPCRVTDARNITTTYAYDAENRLTGKTYSNGDPAVSYFYDQLQRTDHHQRKGTAHGHERRLRPVGLELRQRRPYPDRAAHHRRDHQEPRVLLQRERRSDDSHLSERSGD